MARYILPNGQVVDVPQGASPPTGAIALPDTAGTNLLGGQGISSDMFDAARLQASTRQSGPTTIPIFRERKTATIDRFIKEGADNKAIREMAVAPTAEQFEQEMANAKFSEILFDQKKLEEWQKLVVKAGILTPTEATDAVKLEAAWKTAVNWALNIKAATKGKTEVTPFEALEAVAQNTGAAALAAQAYAKEHFTGTKTVTSKSTNSTYGAQEGEALRQLLGRNPTPDEERAYRRGLAEYAEANPVITAQSTTYQNGEAVAIDQQTSGGYDQSAAAWASASSATPEVAANQQATTYYDALVRALGSAV